MVKRRPDEKWMVAENGQMDRRADARCQMHSWFGFALRRRLAKRVCGLDASCQRGEGEDQGRSGCWLFWGSGGLVTGYLGRH